MLPRQNAGPIPGTPRIRPVLRLEHHGDRGGLEHRAVPVGAAAEQRGHVAAQVRHGRVGPAAGRGHQLVVAHRPRSPGTQRVPGREPLPDPRRPDEVGVRHAERFEDVPAQVPVQRRTAHVLDELAERGEVVVGVDEPGTRFGRQPQRAAAVPRERGYRLPDPDGLAEQRSEHVARPYHLGQPGGVGQQVPQRRRPVAGPGRDQPVRAQVPVRGGVEVDESLLPQLHHGDRGERLADRADPEHGFLGDRRTGREIGETVPAEEVQRSVAYHADREADGGPAVEKLIDRAHTSTVRRPGRGGRRRPARPGRVGRPCAVPGAAPRLEPG